MRRPANSRRAAHALEALWEVPRSTMASIHLGDLGRHLWALKASLDALAATQSLFVGIPSRPRVERTELAPSARLLANSRSVRARHREEYRPRRSES